MLIYKKYLNFINSMLLFSFYNFINGRSNENITTKFYILNINYYL